MKHFLTIFLLAISISTIADAQECKVPISVQLGKVSKNTKDNKNDVLGESFMNYLERHGFTTKIHNTRVAISLMLTESDETCDNGEEKMDVEIKFIDAFSGTVFYTTKLSKQYCGNYSWTREELAADFSKPMPELDSLAEAIRQCVIDAFEINTQHVAEVTQECATQGDHKNALFAILQYPACCPSYPKIRNFTVAIFRDYMKKDHDALFEVAQRVLKNEKTEIEARFVVALLNSDSLDKREQKKADRLLKKVAKDFPSLNLNVKENYTSVPELKALVVREARTIGIECSTSDDIFPETKNFMRNTKIRTYYSDSYDPYDWYRSYMDYYDMYYDYDYNYESGYYTYDAYWGW